MPSDYDHSIHIFISQKTKDMLECITRQHSMTPADIIREILYNVFKNVEMPAKQAKPMKTDGPNFC